MSKIPVIAVFDVGKTNKKLFLFDEEYRIVYENAARFTETEDEDGFPCDNLDNLRQALFDSLRQIISRDEFHVKAVNITTYGASFVYVGQQGEPLTPLYNYLKPYPPGLQRQFYATYGGEERLSLETASPVLGSLNSGLQLYRIKYEQPDTFRRIRYALHLPQYMSYLLTGRAGADITSIGCHTHLWDFGKGNYHEWVEKEDLLPRLGPLLSSDSVSACSFAGAELRAGIGVHDSSAALIPYLVNFREPFVLISTGTWCISLNPFNESPLTAEELKEDCLCYLSYEGKPVKASRLFAGHEHDQQVQRIAAHFNEDGSKYKSIAFDRALAESLGQRHPLPAAQAGGDILKRSLFDARSLDDFSSYEEAYHQLMLDLVAQQYASTRLVLEGTPVKRIFVDGGFSDNPVYMNLLAAAFPGQEVYAAIMAQATALGAALAIHTSWHSGPYPTNIMELRSYSAPQLKVIG
ncbi:MAG: FGGY family carbohydrate kinase [Chitinophagaceae bacterium]